MNNTEFSVELLIALSPLIVIVYGLVAFCIVKIFKEGVANLNKWIWLAIVVIANLVGSIVFLMVGRKKYR